VDERQDLGGFLRTREALIGRAGELLAAVSSLGLVAALFLPWYDPVVQAQTPDGERTPGDLTPSGWEAFELADVVLVVMAALGLLAFLTARALLSRLPYVIAAAAGWFAVTVVLYSFWRPDHLEGLATFSGLPGGGFFFLGLFSAGAMAGGALVALMAPRPEAATA
jgi:hypothetical protein